MIVDDPAEKKLSQRPGSVFREGKLSNPRKRGARALQEFFPENLRNPVRARHAGAVRQFSTTQLDSMHFKDIYLAGQRKKCT